MIKTGAPNGRALVASRLTAAAATKRSKTVVAGQGRLWPAVAGRDRPLPLGQWGRTSPRRACCYLPRPLKPLGPAVTAEADEKVNAIVASGGERPRSWPAATGPARPALTARPPDRHGITRRVYAPPPTVRPLYELVMEHLLPHLTLDTPPARLLDEPEGGELLVRWRWALIHIRLDRTGYSVEIPRRTVARYHSREFRTLRAPGFGGSAFGVREAVTWAGTEVLEYETLALDDALALLQCLFDIIDEAETTGAGRWWG